MRIERRLRSSLAAVVAAATVAAALIAACGGSDEPTFGFEQGPATPARDESSGTPPAALVEPTATPDPPYLLSAAEPIPPAVPPTGLDALLGVAPDDEAATAITDALVAGGYDLTGLELFLFPLPDDQGNMLVIDVDVLLDALSADQANPTALQAVMSTDQNSLLGSLVASDAYDAANVGRVVFNLGLVSTDGTLIITATLASSVFEDMIAGVITQDAGQEQTLTEMRWVEAQ